MKKLFIYVQDSALPIDPELVFDKLHPSIKPFIEFHKIPINSDGKMMSELLEEIFSAWQTINPEGYILLMTSSRIYGFGGNNLPTLGNWEPHDIARWLKSNFNNSFYAIRSIDQYNLYDKCIDFAFVKTKSDIEKGIAENIFEVYKKIPQ